MALVSIPLEKLKSLLGKPELTEKAIISGLELMGRTVDEIITESLHKCGQCGYIIKLHENEEVPEQCSNCETGDIGSGYGDGSGSQSQMRVALIGPYSPVGKRKVLKVEILPNRPDLFDVGGLARGLAGFLGYKTGLAKYDVQPSGITVTVDEVVSSPYCLRPGAAYAVVKGVNLDDETIKIIMEMQEQLHWALGRDRKLASIGIFDLDTLKPDFTYTGVGEEKKFIPLQAKEEMTPLEILENHPKGKAYVHLLDFYTKAQAAGGAMEDYEKYKVPLLRDSRGEVLAMPPIINSDFSKVTLDTKNLFIDVTGLKQETADRAVNILATSFMEMGASVESVKAVFSDGTERVTPDLAPVETLIDSVECSRWTGIPLDAAGTARELEKMRHGTEVEDNLIRVNVPAYRVDIMHRADIFEDVAIGFGYNNIKTGLVPTMTIGREREIDTKSSLLRRLLTGTGFLETVSLMLTNREDHFEKMRVPEVPYVTLEDPISEKQELVRVHLLNGLFETFIKNTQREMPQKVFELGDVVHLDEAQETGTKDIRYMAGGILSPSTGFAEVKAIVQMLLAESGRQGAKWEVHEHPSFISGRCARILDGETGEEFCILGEIHPEVLVNWGLKYPVAAFQMVVGQGWPE